MNHLVSVIILVVTISCTKPDSMQTNISLATNIEYQNLEHATFAGGCFWCTEAVFERVRGVHEVISGYTGGDQKNPTYKQVSYGKTDHAEAVQISFDPNEISYQEMVEIFFATHDPTTLDRQGPDIGKQYRSAVYYHNSDQKEIALLHIKALTDKGKYPNPIVTQVEAVKTFYPAEDYHQDYYKNNPNNPYIQAIAKPKVVKLKKLFKDKLKASS
jgi:peptide-methionine (S)-S-oxide reductase